MAVTTSYPGIYIQELPSLVHSITPAPTSIAVFVGYTHPFHDNAFGIPVQLFSFADYQTQFGGFFSSPWLPDYVGQAVYQFFQNGGSTCLVVGLKADLPQASVTLPSGLLQDHLATVTFEALQPVGIPATPPATEAVGIPMQVAISNLQQTNSSDDTADIIIAYSTTVETYRKVLITNIQTALRNSNLVNVTLSGAPDTYTATGSPYSLGYGNQAIPLDGSTVIKAGDFTPVFMDSAPLDKVPVFNLLVTPGVTDNVVTSAAVAYCERKRAFYIMDTPSSSSQTPSWAANAVVQDLTKVPPTLSPTPPVSTNAAVYYPWLMTADPVTGSSIVAPPSGFVAGIYSQEDSARGVWKSPAGIETAILGTTGVDPNGVMTDPQQGILNQNAINCIRQFPGTGTVVFGARTTAGANANTAQQQWRYVAVRRMALFIEQTLYANLTWAVFEGNDTPLWNALTQEVTAFMLSLFRQGAFAGNTPSQAFVVQCDSTTTTPTDVANGVVNILVGFAPLVPTEFVVVQIAQLAGQAQS
jgi:hypothetical protein